MRPATSNNLIGMWRSPFTHWPYLRHACRGERSPVVIHHCNAPLVVPWFALSCLATRFASTRAPIVRDPGVWLNGCEREVSNLESQSEHESTDGRVTATSSSAHLGLGRTFCHSVEQGGLSRRWLSHDTYHKLHVHEHWEAGTSHTSQQEVSRARARHGGHSANSGTSSLEVYVFY